MMANIPIISGSSSKASRRTGMKRNEQGRAELESEGKQRPDDSLQELFEETVWHAEEEVGMSAGEAATSVMQKIAHLPDYRFAAWCLRQYGVNRGIYNTIDERLFQFGIKEIVTRRMTILAFLNQVQQSNLHRGKGKRIKFGKGLLISTLTRFLNQEVAIASVRSATDDSKSEGNDPWH